jgi:hypothetical protein
LTRHCLLHIFFDRFGLRQFPAEPARRHPRQQQQLHPQPHYQQHYLPNPQQPPKRFSKSFHELLADMDAVNCMETLDKKISATDEALVRTT